MQSTIENANNPLKRCINCGSASIRHNHNALKQPHRFQEIIAHWIKDLPENHKFCKECYEIIDNLSQSSEKEFPQRVFGHRLICIGCGKSLLTEKQRHREVADEYLQYWPWHKTCQHKLACCKCHLRLGRLLLKLKRKSTRNDPENEVINLNLNSNPENEHNAESGKLQTNLKSALPTIQDYSCMERTYDNKIAPKLTSDGQIILLNGERPPNSSSRCYAKNCKGNHRKCLPKPMRLINATYYDIFIADKIRSCHNHLSLESYERVKYETKNFCRNFTTPQFESYVDDIKTGIVVIDFENVEAMPNHICEYWTGLKVAHFLNMYENLKRRNLTKTALATYLIKKITNDSVQKLAKLFNVNSATLIKQVRIVEKHFSDEATMEC